MVYQVKQKFRRNTGGSQEHARCYLLLREGGTIWMLDVTVSRPECMQNALSVFITIRNPAYAKSRRDGTRRIWPQGYRWLNPAQPDDRIFASLGPRSPLGFIGVWLPASHHTL